MTLKFGGGQGTILCTQFTQVNGATPYPSKNALRVISENSWNLERGETPNFHDKVRAGALLPFQHFKHFSVIGKYDSSYAWTHTSPTVPPTVTQTWWDICADLGPGGIYYPTDHDALFQTCFPSPEDYVQAAAAQLYGSGWDGLTFLGELHQTVAMFRKIGLSLAAIPKDIGGTWLQGRYGWRTLYYDFLDLQKMINNIDDHRKRFKETSRGAFQISRDIDTSFSWSSSYGSYRRHDEITVAIAGQVIADIEPPKVQLNPFVTAYELTTLSFMVDWFINIGQYIQALSFLAIQQNYKCGYGWKVGIVSNYSMLSCVGKTYFSVTNASLSSNVSTLKKVRVPMATIPLGVSTIRRLNSLKVADIVAIVTQRFGYKIRII